MANTHRFPRRRRRGPRDRAGRSSGRRVRRLVRPRARAPRRPASDGPGAPRRRRRRQPGRVAGGYTGRPASIEYSIWGDPAEIDSQTDARRGVQGGQPEHRRQGHVSRTGTPTGTSSRPGSPAAPRPTSSRWTARSFPDYQARDVLLDLQAVHRRATGTTWASSPTRASAYFTTADGGQYGLPRDLNVDRPLLQQGRCSTRPGSRTPTTRGTGPSSSRSASS